MSDPREIIAMNDRIMQVIRSEFPHLTPAEVHFGLSSMCSFSLELFNKKADEISHRKGGPV